MRRALNILVLTLVAVGLCWWVATLPGQVEASFGTYRYSASIPVTVLLVLATFLLFYTVLRLAGGAIRLPARLRRARAARDRRQGDKAVTGALLALAAGNGAEARQQAACARRLLGDQPQTLLLAAQAARASGFEEEAEDVFRTLSGRDDAAFLGLRGLLRQAVAREDWVEAAALAKRAEEAYPGAAWLRAERTRLAVRSGAWREALQLTTAARAETADTARLGALATAAALQEPNVADARRLAKQGFETDPANPAAALSYAAQLRADGRESRVEDVLRRAWDANPHPDLAETYLAPAQDPAARLQAGQRLVKSAPDSPDAHLLLARLYLEAGQTGDARRHAEAARAAGLAQRRVFATLAAIADAEPGEGARLAQREASRQAESAAPDPAWHCTSCGRSLPAWAATCPTCHQAGSVRWGV